MNAKIISLRAMRHPITLICIGLLVLNDHLLKATFPSILTGKLSDFSGLFFFPFLLAAALSITLERFQIPTRRVPAISFGITFFWFAGIKIVPGINNFTETIVSSLSGLSAQIIMDKSDLPALLTLLPAWLLWKRLENSPSQQPPRISSYLALSIAALGTMATTCPGKMVEVTQVVNIDSTLYARGPLIDGYSQVSAEYEVYSSSDGKRWNKVELVSELVAQEFNEKHPEHSGGPIILCNPNQPSECYRISWREYIERSIDGGLTWEEDWKEPMGRNKYMQRISYKLFPMCANPPPNPILYDLDFLGQRVIAAMGNEGVMIRSPDGSWERYAVGDVVPAPYSAKNILDLLKTLFFENIFTLLFSILYFNLLCYLGWRAFFSHHENSIDNDLNWPINKPLTILLLVIVSIWLISIFLSSSIFSVLLSSSTSISWGILKLLVNSLLLSSISLIVILPIILIRSTVLAWRRVVSLPIDRRQDVHLVRYCLGSSLVFFACTWVPFVLWAYNVIPIYEYSMTISIILGVIVLLLGILIVRHVRYNGESFSV